MGYDTMLRIRDETGSPNYAGSALFLGSPVYAYSFSITMGGKNNISERKIPLGSQEIIDADGGSLENNWNRRKGYISLNSTNNLIINVSGNWDPEQVGSFDDNGSMLLSPHKIMRMALSDRRFYIWDNVLIGSLTQGELASGDFGTFEAGSSYYDDKGIPVVIEDWNFERNVQRQDMISWNILFREDKVV